MKNKFNQLFALLLVFLSAQAYSNPINEINFIGLNNTSERILLKEININVGDEYSDAASNKIIESLFKTGLFSDISVTNIQGSLSITLVENPTIKFFDVTLETDSSFRSWLKGEKMFLSEELIQQDLDDNNLSVGSAYSESKLDNFILLLESKYSSSGYYNVKINTNITVDSQNRAGVDLTINQGERATEKDSETARTRRGKDEGYNWSTRWRVKPNDETVCSGDSYRAPRCHGEGEENCRYG